MSNTPPVLWRPSKAFADGSRLKHYMNYLKETRGLTFENYQALWKWSVEELAEFWESLWMYFDVISYAPYERVI
ncbi:MAG TPA: acetoacetate--CoA ligase, partial [Phaeodactylibacter sp.]|nr:acetoacetate--CoA ligase [Phaeodactylibacter sp.]